MNIWIGAGISAIVLIGAAALVAHLGYRKSAAQADAAYRDLLADVKSPGRRFDLREVDALPEIAQRYFRNAIAPGTQIYSAAEVQMEGRFLLGDKTKHQSYVMEARQAIRLPDEFVWVPQLRSGILTISGSDAFAGGEAWTRFHLLRLIPVASVGTSPDMLRSARFRGALESALWLPFSLLPGNGAEWTQTGANTAQVTWKGFEPDPLVIRLTLSPSGAVREVVGQRWSNANADKQFRYQPFGASFSAEGTFQGVTVPTQIAAGNHYGLAEYLPFFQAKVTSIRYR